MINNQYEIYDKNNNKYIIQEYSGAFTCKKVLPDNTLVDPTIEELQYIISELQNIKNKEKTQKYDYESLLDSLKKMIDEGQLNSLEEIKKYVELLEINQEDKDKLTQEGYAYYNSKTRNTSPIVAFKDKLINQLRKESKKEKALSISFNVIDNISGPSYCKISLDSHEESVITNLEMESFDYTDELKRELIEPVLEELVLSAEVYPLNISPVPGGIYRSNMNLSTVDNKYASLNNIEDSYATDLSTRLEHLMQESKIKDESSRDSRINELNQEKKNQKSRKLEKKDLEDKKGFSHLNLIYAIISLTISLTLLLQIIFIK